MSKKNISLVDAFLFHNAKKEINKLTEKEKQDTIRTVSGQGNNVIIPVQERYNTVKTPVQGRYPDNVEDGQDKDSIPHKQIRLAKQQQAIYDWFLQKGFKGNFSKPQIAREINIPLETIRKSIKKFEKINLIYFEYDPCIKEYEYQINTDISVIRKDTIRTPSGQGDNVIGQVQKTHCSSSFLYNKTTTTADGKISDIESALNDHPELGYWRQKKLTSKQIESWMKTADCGLDLMTQYLCYCRFEMVDLGKDKKIDNAHNYFFRIIERTGAYPKPKGYKSHSEKQVEAEQQLIEDREKQIQKLKSLQRTKWEQERDLEFWEMMNDPGGDRYKQCFKKLKPFEKGRAKKGGKTFETAMRRVFDEMTEA